MVSTLQKISDVLTKIIKVVMVVLFAWMVISLGIQVFARYIFHKSFVWTDESARYCMIWMVFLGASEILFNDEHIKVTVIEDLLHGASKKVLAVIQDIIGLVFSIMLAYYSFRQLALACKAVSSNMGVNMGIIYTFFPIFTILMIIAYVFRLILVFAGGDKGEQLREGGEQA